MNTHGALVLGREAKEVRLASVVHPEFLRLDGTVLHRIDDPALKPLHDGEPLLGWEGDDRLALYLDGRSHAWVLVRLEADGVYRGVTRTTLMAKAQSSVDRVGELIGWLISHDTRRGYNAKVAVDAHNSGVEAAAQRHIDDLLEGHVADKMRWALKKDKADYYV